MAVSAERGVDGRRRAWRGVAWRGVATPPYWEHEARGAAVKGEGISQHL